MTLGDLLATVGMITIFVLVLRFVGDVILETMRQGREQGRAHPHNEEKGD